MLQIIQDHKDTPQNLMDFDKELLSSLKNDPRMILHLYRWDRPAASYGHFLNPYDWADEVGLKKHGVTLAKRPTGGGMVFHLTDLAFSFLIPSDSAFYSRNTLKNYCLVNQIVMKALKPFFQGKQEAQLLDYQPDGDHASSHFCMALPTMTDIALENKKLSGGALRTTRFGFLHQGTISLCPVNEELMKDVFATRPGIYEDMKKNSAYLNAEPLSEKALESLRKEVESSLKSTLLHEGSLASNSLREFL